MQMNFGQLLLIKGRALLLPCLSWSILITLMYAAIRRYTFPEIVDFFAPDIYSNLWFLKSCFLCYVIAYVGLHSRLKSVVWVPVTLLISLCMPKYGVNAMYVMFLVGMWQRKSQAAMARL